MRARRRIVRPQSRFGMALGHGFADRQTVPHGQGLAAFRDLQHRHLAGGRMFQDLLAGGGRFGLAQADIHVSNGAPAAFSAT